MTMIIRIQALNLSNIINNNLCQFYDKFGKKAHFS